MAEKKQVLKMNVQTSKCLVGIKAANPTESGSSMLKKELSINVMLDILFGKSSENYTELYGSGLIDDTFSFDYSEEYGFGFAMVGGDTNEPDVLASKLEAMLMDAKAGRGLTAENLERTKKKKIGAFLRAVNSPEYIANQFTRYAFNDMDLFDVVPVLESLTLDDLKQAASELIAEERFTVCQVVPKDKQ